MRGDVLMLEELSLNSFPALSTHLYDGWLLRFSDGYTNRANSVNPLYLSSIKLNEKIDYCENVYISQGLPTVFKLTEHTDRCIEDELVHRGYELVFPTTVMTMGLDDTHFSMGDCVLKGYADHEWFIAYFTFSGNNDNDKRKTAQKIIENIKNPILCARIVKNGETVACGSCVTERGFASLLNIVVAPLERGKGYGRELCSSLLNAAKRLSAHTAYLQVVTDNKAAFNLYESLGYKPLYSYWYRVKKEHI